MSFTAFLLIIAIVSIIFIFLLKLFKVELKSLLISYLQAFFGFLFLASGFVKGVDPLGFSFKMEEYFQEFQTLFEPTFLSFLNPMFLFFEHQALYVGIFMIILEMIIGVMLLIGFRPKFTAWAFFLLMLFFTLLTGYTYLTGYVPKEANFFEFNKWVAYDQSNMRVTDCGCFGDFIKFSAWQTFLKDVIMLIPGVLFIFLAPRNYRLFTSRKRALIIFVSIILFFLFNLYNYKWSEPIIDFRPFKEGVNIREQKEIELNSFANVKERAVKLQNKSTNEILELPSEQYNATLDQYPREKFAVLDRLYYEPEIPTTEISDFLIEDFDGNDMTEQLLSDKNYSFMIVSPTMKGDPQPISYILKDTIYKLDTVRIANTDSSRIVKTLVGIEEKQVDGYDYKWDEDYMLKFKKYFIPVIDQIKKDKYFIFMVSSTSPEMVSDFIKDGGPDIQYYNSDDTTLKTVIRSNPGLVLLKDGMIIKKWHYKRIPDYEKMKNEFLK